MKYLIAFLLVLSQHKACAESLQKKYLAEQEQIEK